MSIIMPRANMLSVIRRLGLTNGLKICLDAGDGVSYSGSGQTWSDVSGNGHHFYRGETSGSESSDPTFSGTAGRRSNGEFFGFDGDDFLTLASGSNPAWAQNLHKDGAKFTIVVWGFFVGPSTRSDVFGSAIIASQIGINWRFNSSHYISFLSARADATPSLNVTASPLGAINNELCMLAISLDEAVGADGGLMVKNGGAPYLFNSTYYSPSASNASYLLTISGSSGWYNLPVGSKIYNLMVWEGVVLTSGQLQAMFQATRGKFGI